MALFHYASLWLALCVLLCAVSAAPTMPLTKNGYHDLLRMMTRDFAEAEPEEDPPVYSTEIGTNPDEGRYENHAIAYMRDGLLIDEIMDMISPYYHLERLSYIEESILDIAKKIADMTPAAVIKKFDDFLREGPIESISDAFFQRIVSKIMTMHPVDVCNDD